MAKQSYRIPSDLNASYGDMEIAIQTQDGMGVKPLPIKVIMTYIGSVVLCFYVCSHTIVASGSTAQLIMFVILWILMTLFLARFDKTKRMSVELIPVLLNYIPTAHRKVSTREDSHVGPFLGMVGISSINPKTGLVSYMDGTVGYWYRVVGSASILLFDDDRNLILDRVDRFYQKISAECEVSFITTKSAQKIYKQVANLVRKYKALGVKDADLTFLLNEQLGVLKDYIGGSFKSVHQYMIIKGDNKEALMRAKNVLQSEVENSSLMIKQCVPLYYDDIVEILKLIYSGEAV